MKPKYFLLAMLFLLAPAMVLADDTDHVGCDQVMLKAGMMGKVNEESLQKHIDQTRADLDEIKRSPGRHAERRREMLRMHLASMRSVMEEMHDLKLKQGCAEATHGSSIEARLNFMENNIDMMQKIMEQLLEHQQELERE